jgi:hypothetical protein
VSDLAATAQGALDDLKDAFYALDTQQRDVRMQVESYSHHLPSRISKSGLVPRFRILDTETDALVREYLDVLDRFPIVPKMRPETLHAQCNTYLRLREQISRQVDVLVQFVADYDAEFRRVATEVQRIQRIRNESSSTLLEATRLWQEFRAEGYESADADRALAKARIAGRAVESWSIEQGVPALNEAAALVVSFSEGVTEIVADFRAQVRRARSRGVTLRTRLEAIDTRSETVEDDLRTLRREFSAANFRDLEEAEKARATRRAELTPLLTTFEEAARSESWAVALPTLTQLEDALDAIEAVVDAPRTRLQALRSFKTDPEVTIGKARFAVRDAQLMVVRTPGAHLAPFGARLDRLAARLDVVPPLLEAVHPDYLRCLREIDDVRQQVKDVVAEVRRSRSAG